MRIDPLRVFEMVGIEAVTRYPVTADCPLCGGIGKLELRTTEHIQCRSCFFSGDLVQLYTAKKGTDITTAVSDLQRAGILDIHENDRGSYIRDTTFQFKIKGVINQNMAWVRKNGFATTIPAVLERLNCRQYLASLPVLVPYVIPMRRDDLINNVFEAFTDIPKEAKDAWAWWGNYSALAVPVFRGTEIIGLELMTTAGTKYLTLLGGSKLTGAAFGSLPAFSDSVAVVLDNIETALRYTLWGLTDHGTVTPFVVPRGIADDVEPYRCGRVVYWSPTGSPLHYVRALTAQRVQVLDHTYAGKFDAARELPFSGSFGRLLSAAQEAIPAHQAIAIQLNRMPENEARATIATSRISPADRAKILAYVGGEDGNRLANLFQTSPRNESITWGNDIITDTEDGWVCRGRIVSAAKFYIEKIRPRGNTGEATAEGVILYKTPQGNHVSFRFTDQITTIRKNTADWLQRRIVSETGFIPFSDPGWSRRLIEVSQQFHAPTPILGTEYYGWTEGVLRMPNFLVDTEGLRGSRALVEGPAMLLPAPLSETEWDSFSSETFCRVFLALLGNVIRTKQGRPGYAILLANEPHVVCRLSDALSAQIYMNPRRDILEDAALQPLPVLTDWSHKALQDFFLCYPNPANVVINTDSRTAMFAALRATWLRLDVQGNLNYDVLRAVFLVLPEILRAPAVHTDRDDFYRRVVDLLGVTELFRNRRTELMHAALYLDARALYTPGTLARRIMELLVQLHNSGDLAVTMGHEIVRVSTLNFIAAVTSPILPAPDIQLITQALAAARFITTPPKGHSLPMEWRFPVALWDIQASMALS